MRKSIEELLENYQIRRTKEQKNSFINWLEQHAKTHNYTITRQNYSKKGTNIIVGDIKSSDIILTAHYDTPHNLFFPIVSNIGNIFSFTINQFFLFISILIPIMTIFFAVGLTTQALTQNDLITDITVNIVLLTLLYLLIIGVPNKKNANDNTSGVAVLTSLLEDLPHKERRKVCFVFFDEEEKGLKGAKGFKKEFCTVINDKPLINFDCVGNGNTFMFIMKKTFRESKYSELITSSLNNNIVPKKNTKIVKASSNIYMSDQLIFKNSIGVVAVKRIPLLGNFLVRIHSFLDTKIDVKNIELLSQIMIDFIK